jgi:hypothetical protein
LLLLCGSEEVELAVVSLLCLPLLLVVVLLLLLEFKLEGDEIVAELAETAAAGVAVAADGAREVELTTGGALVLDARPSFVVSLLRLLALVLLFGGSELIFD